MAALNPRDMTTEQRREHRRKLHAEYLRKHCANYVRDNHPNAANGCATLYAEYFIGRVDLSSSEDWPAHSEVWPGFLRDVWETQGNAPEGLEFVQPYAFHLWTVGPFTFSVTADSEGEAVRLRGTVNDGRATNLAEHYSWPITVETIKTDCLKWARARFAEWIKEPLEIIS